MKELLEQLQSIRADGERAMAATLVATSGPSPRRVGARLWIGESGRSLGSVSVGGCIDARVAENAPDVIRTGEPRTLNIDMGDPALDLGFTCNGLLHVLLEPIDEAFLAAYEQAAACVQRRGAAIRLRRLNDNFEQLLVCDDGRTQGSLGSRELDEAARECAQSLLSSRQSTMLTLRESERVFAEVLQPAARLVVLGVGPVAPPLLRLANALGWETVAVDARAQLANRTALPDAQEIKTGDPAAFAAALNDVANTAVVLLSHDYKYDLPVLRAVLQTEVPYIGMLGSRRRGKAMLDFLADENIPAHQLQRIRVPVGLDIGADSPAELALSVLSEAMAALRGRSGASLAGGKS